LKIRVSVVRFRPRPPYRTVVFARRQRFFTFGAQSCLDAALNAQDLDPTLNESGKGIAPEFVSSDFNTTGGQATVEFAMKYSWTESSH
jgi:hypothetical protein